MAIQYREQLDRSFHALGDGTRRRILSRLAREGSCAAGELGERFESAQPTISRHLKVLERAGLVERRVDGRVHRFRLVPGRLEEADGWIRRHLGFWQGALGRLEAHLGTEDGDDA